MSYLTHTDADRATMLEAIGVTSVEDLFAAIPRELRTAVLDLPPGLPESQVAMQLSTLAERNRIWGARSFLGAGSYNLYVPAAVRALVGRSEFATSYTPYQAEVSQGTLQHIFEFQTTISELTGLPVANASMYDAASSLAEGAFLAARHTSRERIVMSAGVHPEAREVVRTYASGPELPVAELPLDPSSGRTAVPDAGSLQGAAALLVQQPNFFGVIEDLEPLAAAAHAAEALLVVSQNLLTAGVLAPPGEVGADVAVGDVQPFGTPPNYGGPSAGFMACGTAYLRQLPGRLVGETLDADGRRCYALTMQAREQHIRRAKATSNICSNQALVALAATIHLALLGTRGLSDLGSTCVARAHHLQQRLVGLPGVEPAYTGPFFNEFAIRLPMEAAVFAEALRTRSVDPGVPLGRFDEGWSHVLLVAVTDMNAPSDLEAYAQAAADVLALSGGDQHDR
ncbi:MAG: aminomethyl-transferring glycine dehydrogenase subunit GcvPA [Thermoleophilia bacterium]